jgi:hypothetical protein
MRWRRSRGQRWPQTKIAIAEVKKLAVGETIRDTEIRGFLARRLPSARGLLEEAGSAVNKTGGKRGDVIWVVTPRKATLGLAEPIASQRPVASSKRTG